MPDRMASRIGDPGLLRRTTPNPDQKPQRSKSPAHAVPRTNGIKV
jgi:glucosamine-6-phosphate deaminase